MLGIGIGVNAIQQGLGLVSDPGSGPDDSLASVDFKAGTYDYGSNTFEDFLYENTDYGTWEGDVVPGTGFVPATGQQNISLGDALIAEALAGGTGLTVVANVVMDSSTDFFSLEAIDLPDWSQDLIARISVDDEVGGVGQNQAIADVTVADSSTVPAGSVRVGCAFSSAGVRVCANGGSALFSALTSDFIVNFVGIWVNSATIEDMTFYSGAKSEAELLALTA